MDQQHREEQRKADAERRPEHDSGSPQERRQVLRGEQGTSAGDPHDDTDPQSG
ncbi:hypothetical protein ACFWY9_29400 [Amycolatopsis sp. NPDC059027]|uniref:hypothetical protein n=1 Tax=unclassified Amycolatopsis TaxID=2618356 RepID=UPI0036708AB4